MILTKLNFFLRCCNGERKLRYDPVIAGHIIYSCGVVYNIMKSNNVPFEDLPVDDPRLRNNFPPMNFRGENVYRRLGTETRNAVINMING